MEQMKSRNKAAGDSPEDRATVSAGTFQYSVLRLIFSDYCSVVFCFMSSGNEDLSETKTGRYSIEVGS